MLYFFTMVSIFGRRAPDYGYNNMEYAKMRPILIVHGDMYINHYRIEWQLYVTIYSKYKFVLTYILGIRR